jgi:putative drug exporter of the RND superfamily
MNLAAISRFVLGHKRLVGLAWLVIFVASVGLLRPALDQLSENFASPGTESYDANVEILARYGGVGGLTDPVVPVIPLPDGTTVDSPGIREEIDTAFARVQEAIPTARIATWTSTGDDAFVSDDRQTTFGLVYLPSRGEEVAGLPAVEQALEGATVGGADVLVSGRPVLAGGSEEAGGVGVLVEVLIGATGALIILLYIFGSLLAFLPLFIAAISILASFLVIGGIASVMEISFIVQFLVALIGLGIAIDYSLLVVTRWREEREAGYDNQTAVQRAMETAGHAVIFSGTTVGVGLLALIVLPIQMLRGIGIGGMIIPLVSVIVTITLLPIILATVGPRLDWPRNRRGAHHGHGWQRWATGVVRHRWAAAIVAMALLVLLLIPALRIELGAPRPDALNGSAGAEAGMFALEESGIDAGVMSPFEIVVHGDPVAVAEAISKAEGVRGAVAPDGQAWRRDESALVVALPQSNGSGSAASEILGSIRDVTHGLDGDISVGGAIATGGDFVDKAYGQLPLMIAAISLITFVLLVRAFRSLILPLKALFLNVLSVGASFGVLVLVWQWGWGSELIWGIPSTGSITDWVPIATFAFLFGLSMDYEVFILSRMREEYDATGDTDAAIVRGLGLTGRLVTCAALILFFAFAALAAAPITENKILATGLAAGILLDATVVRALLVPALVSLMGHWNWWLPSWLGWLAPEPVAVTGDARPTPAVRSHGVMTD